LSWNELPFACAVYGIARLQEGYQLYAFFSIGLWLAFGAKKDLGWKLGCSTLDLGQKL